MAGVRWLKPQKRAMSSEKVRSARSLSKVLKQALKASAREPSDSPCGKSEGGATLVRYVLAWVPMLMIAIANGALRQATFGKVMPELRAHQLSTLIGSVAIGLFIWLVIRAWPPSSGRHALLIGLVWLILAVAFEFFMGLVLAQRPLAHVLHDYNVLAGRVWVFFLVWLTLAPWVFFRLRGAV